MATKKQSKDPESEKLFWALEENNDWEGETWRHWFQHEGNEAAVQYLTDQEIIDDDAFSIVHEGVPENHVDILVQYATGGYMSSDNKCPGIIDLAKLKKAVEKSPDNSLMYKAGLVGFIKKKR